MALIICIECGKEFSDKAPECPNCGCPTEDIIAEISDKAKVTCANNCVISSCEIEENNCDATSDNGKDNEIDNSNPYVDDVKKSLIDVGSEVKQTFEDVKRASSEALSGLIDKDKIDKSKSEKSNVISINKKFNKLVIALVVLLAAVGLCIGVVSCNNSTERIVWDELYIGHVIPQPEKTVGVIECNTNQKLEVRISDYPTKNYRRYKEKCIDIGFENLAENENGKYKAYNDDGFYLQLEEDTRLDEILIYLEAPMEMEKTDFTEYKLSNLLPEPTSKYSNAEKDTENNLIVYVGKTTRNNYMNYIEECKALGYTNITTESERCFEAYNEEDNKLKLEFYDYQLMKISLKVPIYPVKIKFACRENLVMNKYNVDIKIAGEDFGTLAHGTSDTFDLRLKKGTYTIKVVNTEDESIKGTKNFKVNGNSKLKCKIWCDFDEIELTLIAGINPPLDNDDIKGMSKSKVIEAYQKAGFTDVKVKPLNILDESELEQRAGLAKGIMINDKELISKNNLYYSDSKVTVEYYAGKKIKSPVSNYNVKEKENYKTVVKQFKEAGFVNVSAVKAKQPYGKKARNGNVHVVFIDGDDWVYDDNKYPIDSKVVVEYYSINYSAYSVTQMISDIDSNVMRAQEKYDDKYVKVTGRVEVIDKQGDFALLPTNDPWEIRQVACNTPTDQKEIVKNLSNGQTITVYGKITVNGKPLV